jgi:hypothetical protein
MSFFNSGIFFAEGFDAQALGVRPQANRHAAESHEAETWLAGWKAAEIEAAVSRTLQVLVGRRSKRPGVTQPLREKPPSPLWKRTRSGLGNGIDALWPA